MRNQDTLETGDVYARARLHQNLIGLGVGVLALIAYKIGALELSVAFGFLSGKLMPTSTILAPKP